MDGFFLSPSLRDHLGLQTPEELQEEGLGEGGKAGVLHPAPW